MCMTDIILYHTVTLYPHQISIAFLSVFENLLSWAQSHISAQEPSRLSLDYLLRIYLKSPFIWPK